jgi:hypothetical protein
MLFFYLCRFDWAVSADELGQSVILSGRLVTVVDDNRKAAENELIDFFNKVRVYSSSA